MIGSGRRCSVSRCGPMRPQCSGSRHALDWIGQDRRTGAGAPKERLVTFRFVPVVSEQMQARRRTHAADDSKATLLPDRRLPPDPIGPTSAPGPGTPQRGFKAKCDNRGRCPWVEGLGGGPRWGGPSE